MRALPLGDRNRLRRIAEIIADVDRRCMAADGPVTPTLQEMTTEELRTIYRLAQVRPVKKGRP